MTARTYIEPNKIMLIGSKLTLLRTSLERRMLQKLLGLFIKANEGECMSHDYSAIKNKHQTHPKVYFEQYLANSEEPLDNVSNDRHGLEAKLLENSDVLRRRFRNLAQRLRNRYS